MRQFNNYNESEKGHSNNIPTAFIILLVCILFVVYSPTVVYGQIGDTPMKGEVDYQYVDSLTQRRGSSDSLANSRLTMIQDSTIRIKDDSISNSEIISAIVTADSAKPQSRILNDSMNLYAKKLIIDTLKIRGGVLSISQEMALDDIRKKLDSLPQKDKIKVKKEPSEIASERSRLFKDTLSFTTVASISLGVPGFGQIYNRDYWKLPVLYGSVGGFVGLSLRAGKQFKDYNSRYESALLDKLPQEDIDFLQRKSTSYSTQRSIFIAGAVCSYLYFVGDAALNYKGAVSSVKKATMLSVIFPGAGQVYNNKYWKLPILYGGMAALGYVIDFNNRGYQRFKTAYKYMSDGDPGTLDEFNGRYSADVLKNTRDSYRRYRDLGIICMAGVYLLNIIDAHVDAYLNRYDISDNLGLKVEPMMQDGLMLSKKGGQTSRMTGLSLKLNF